MGTKHDAEYFRERRRQQGVVPRGDEFLYSAKAVARGRELSLMEQTHINSWPRDLFRDLPKHLRRDEK